MSIVADLASFRILYPEFNGVSDDTVTAYIEIATDSLDDVNWSDCYARAVLAVTAHEIALSQNRQANAQTNEIGQVITSAGSGAITSASAGGISASYAQSASVSAGNDTDAYYSQTQYGQQYLSLKRQCLSYAVLASCL